MKKQQPKNDKSKCSKCGSKLVFGKCSSCDKGKSKGKGCK